MEEERGFLAFGGAPRRHGWTKLHKLVRLDPGRGPAAHFERMKTDGVGVLAPGAPPPPPVVVVVVLVLLLRLPPPFPLHVLLPRPWHEGSMRWGFYSQTSN